MTSHPQKAVGTAALASLVPAILLSALGVSIVAVALPTLAGAFAAPMGAVQWVVIAYLMGTTLTVVLVGRLGDLLGQRPVLLGGIALFAAASAVCTLAPSLGILIAARAAQGIGGAILMAMPISLVRENVAPERTGAAMGLLGTTTAFGTALGPTFGGFILAGFGWRAAFATLAVCSVLVFALALRLPPTPRRGERATVAALGLPSAAILALALTAYALLAAGVAAGIPFAPLSLAALAAVGIALFLKVEARAATPLVPVAVMRQRTIGLSLAMNALVTTVMMATFVVGPFYLAFGLGLDAATVGLVMAAGPVAAALSGVPAGRITDRFGARRVVRVGLAQMVIALVGLSLLPRAFGIPGYVLPLMVMTPGFQLFLAANNTAVMFAAPEGRRGTLSGLLGLSRNLGLMTGASAMGALFAAALGTHAVTDAPAATIGRAFTITFLTAAGMVATALTLALFDRSAPRD